MHIYKLSLLHFLLCLFMICKSGKSPRKTFVANPFKINTDFSCSSSKQNKILVNVKLPCMCVRLKHLHGSFTLLFSIMLTACVGFFLAFLCCSEYIAFTTEVEAYFFKIFISIMFQICFKVICRGIETESLYMYIFVKNVVIKIIISVFTYLHMSV